MRERPDIATKIKQLKEGSKSRIMELLPTKLEMRLGQYPNTLATHQELGETSILKGKIGRRPRKFSVQTLTA